MKIHPSITPKSAKLLQRVAKRILKHHEEYNQSRFISEYGSGCCIAGHIWVMINGSFPSESWKVNKFASTQIDPTGNLDTSALFIFWPSRLRKKYLEAKTSKGRARVGYRRIMHYLRTGE